MSSFLPSRASPQASPRHRPRSGGIPNLSSIDITVSSANTSASAALSGLSTKDVELIDEIIERSPPTATTFLTVFKAYNEVLQERGMDAANDVIYYKILLKLGVVKGHDWGAKWETVKMQLGYVDEDDAEKATTPIPRSARVAALPTRGGIRIERPESRRPLPFISRQLEGNSRPSSSRLPPPLYGRDSVTVHSHQDDATETTGTETETGAETEAGTETGTEPMEEQEMTSNDEFSSSPTTLIQRERASDTKENALQLSTSYPPLPTIEQFLPVQGKHLHSDYSAASDLLSKQPARSSTPPLKQPFLAKRLVPFARQNNIPRIPLTRLTKAPVKQPPLRDTSLNEEDTWKKVKMNRDEKEADKFREVMLLERCWQVWKGGLHWLITIEEKVDKERGKALLQSRLEKWKLRLQTRRKDYSQIGRRHDIHLIKISMTVWLNRLKTRRVTQWKDDMRKRMSYIRKKRDDRIRREAWTRWKHLHQGELADSHYDRRLTSKMFAVWQSQLTRMDHLEAVAIDFMQLSEQNRAANLWDFWKRQTNLYESGKIIRDRVDARLLVSSLGTWKHRMSENCKADVFHKLHIVKNFYRMWKQSLVRHHALEHKAHKYQNRQDAVLLRAVFRVWAARERELLMDRAMATRTLHSAWVAWKSRLGEIRAAEEGAIEFRSRPSSALTKAALNHWHQNLFTRRNLHLQAVQYDEDLLKHRILLVWRVQLRVKLKMTKHAKVARKYLLLRQGWNKWRDKLEEKKRQQRLQVLQQKILQKYFKKWHTIAARQQYNRLAHQRVQALISSRILYNSLHVWTDRVIALKLRELETVEKRDHSAVRLCYDRWKAVFKRHADDIRLMQSYQYVKREEIMRRMFSRWLSAAKTIRHRRLLLQEREEDMKLATVEKAWDQWRERFQAERLRPLEYSLNIQFQKTRVYQAYLIWHSKTKSIPAIQFFSSRTKAKIWRIWREAMPKALQAREARKRDRQKQLAKALDKWVQAYRTKIALKAVARARYLRLPSGAPRQSLPLSSALSGVLRSSNSVTSGRITRPASPSVVEQSERRSTVPDDLESNTSSRPARRRPLALRPTRLTVAKPTSGSSVPKERKTDLWHELRRAQRKPATEYL
ncbi:Sfi1 spindle body protein-domain-containing protein [Phellopilus nigrolimitatus]|nr:Sfi1 spindle body protein-domain-containing protein [Phellopilus nigrolimitatus]